MSTSIKVEKENQNETRQATTDTIKNLNRLDTLMVTECGKRCLSNLKTDKLLSAENLCLTSCYTKFNESLEIGEKLFTMYSNQQVNTSSLMKGKYDEVINSVKPAFNL
jgi:hypothetical protein